MLNLCLGMKFAVTEIFGLKKKIIGDVCFGVFMTLGSPDLRNRMLLDGHEGNVDKGEIPKNKTAVVFVCAVRCWIEQQCVLLQFSQLLKRVRASVWQVLTEATLESSRWHSLRGFLLPQSRPAGLVFLSQTESPDQRERATS